MKAVVAAFNQEKALVGAFSVITNLRMDLFEALVPWRAIILVGSEETWELHHTTIAAVTAEIGRNRRLDTGPHTQWSGGAMVGL